MREQSEIRKLLTVGRAGALAWLVGYCSSTAVTIFGIVRGFNNLPFAFELTALGFGLGAVLAILMFAFHNRLQDRSWDLIKRHPDPFATKGPDSLVVSRQADGLAKKSASVEARRAHQLSERLALLAQAERLQEAKPQLTANVMLYLSPKAPAIPQPLQPGLGLVVLCRRGRRIRAHDGWPLLGDTPLLPGEQRRLGFVLRTGEKGAAEIRAARKFLLWRNGVVGEGVVIGSGAK